MPKANLTLADGTTVVIDGTAEEVAALLGKISAPAAPSNAKGGRQGKRRTTASAKSGKARKGPQTLLNELATEGWFKSKRTIGDVQKKLEEKGHIYALYSLSRHGGIGLIRPCILRGSASEICC